MNPDLKGKLEAQINREREQDKILPKKFTIANHNHLDYLEIIILEDGTAYYAQPSHQQCITNIFNVNHDEIPIEYWFSILKYLCNTYRVVSIHNEKNILYPKEISICQKRMLKRLEIAKLIKKRGEA